MEWNGMYSDAWNGFLAFLKDPNWQAWLISPLSGTVMAFLVNRSAKNEVPTSSPQAVTHIEIHNYLMSKEGGSKESGIDPGAVLILYGASIVLLLWCYGRHSAVIIDWLRSFSVGLMFFALASLLLLIYARRVRVGDWLLPFIVVPGFFNGSCLYGLKLATESQVPWLPDVVLRDGVFGLITRDLNTQQSTWVLFQALGLAAIGLLALMTATWVVHHVCLANALSREGGDWWKSLARLTRRFGGLGALVAMFVCFVVASFCVSNTFYELIYRA